MTDVEDIDYEAELNRLISLAPTTAGEFMRGARISSTSLEGFWSEVSWEVCKVSSTGPPRLVNKGSLAKEIYALFKSAGGGMGGIGEAADQLLQAWRDAGGTPMDLTAAIKRWRR